MASIETTQQLKEAIRRGAYAWPGGYPLALLTSDGGTLHIKCGRENYREVYQATRDHDDSGWRVTAVFPNWEDGELRCDHCNERIESAYADDDD